MTAQLAKPIKIGTEINEGDVIALGDVHGTWELYSQFLSWVYGSGARVVLLGDLIDRGGEDIPVLDATERILRNPEVWGLQSFTVLKGNHEQMFLEAAKGDTDDILLWMQNGGNIQQMEEMSDKHLDWISNLPVYATIGDTLFVHAGLIPGEDPQVTVESGQGEELYWIRGKFLRNGPKLCKWTDTIKKVIHGHTITSYGEKAPKGAPVIEADRVNIDTGAFLPDGCLTAYNVTQNSFTQFHRSPNGSKSKSSRKRKRQGEVV